MPARRWTDASKLSFPLQLVITIVAGFLAAAIGVWSAQSRLELNQANMSAEMRTIQTQLAADVRNILTQMESERRVSEANAKLTEANSAQLKTTVEAMSRRMELQQMQIAQMEKSITLLTAGRK